MSTQQGQQKMEETSAEPIAHFQVDIADSGECYACGGHESLLHGMARLGKRGIPVGCRGGGCGVCKVEITQGDYLKRPMSRDHVSAEEERQGRVLACRVYPRSDVEVRVLGKMKLAVTR